MNEQESAERNHLVQQLDNQIEMNSTLLKQLNQLQTWYKELTAIILKKGGEDGSIS